MADSASLLEILIELRKLAEQMDAIEKQLRAHLDRHNEDAEYFRELADGMAG